MHEKGVLSTAMSMLRLVVNDALWKLRCFPLHAVVIDTSDHGVLSSLSTAPNTTIIRMIIRSSPRVRLHIYPFVVGTDQMGIE